MYCILRGGGGLISNFVRILEMAGIDCGKWYFLNQPMKFCNVILPDESFCSETTVYTKEYVDFVSKIKNYALKNFSSMPQKNFYFFYGRGAFGEERIAKYFASKGYAIVQPERFSVDVQLNIFLNCENFAATLGTLTHNSMFLKDNSNVISIPRFPNYINHYQQALDTLHPLNHFYIDSSLSITTSNHLGPFYFIVSEQLKEFFGDEWTGEYSDEDFIIFLYYIKYALAKNLKPADRAEEYYAPILPKFKEQLMKREDLMRKVGIIIK